MSYLRSLGVASKILMHELFTFFLSHFFLSLVFIVLYQFSFGAKASWQSRLFGVCVDPLRKIFKLAASGENLLIWARRRVSILQLPVNPTTTACLPDNYYSIYKGYGTLPVVGYTKQLTSKFHSKDSGCDIPRTDSGFSGVG